MLLIYEAVWVLTEINKYMATMDTYTSLIQLELFFL